MMKTIVYHNYGSPDVLELQEIGMPAVEDDQALIKTFTASVNPHDWHFLTGTPFLARLRAGLTALQGLRDRGKIQPKQKVIITRLSA
jgi:NADPH:quinone reductase-like Zn-dependent oxidoreductase